MEIRNKELIAHSGPRVFRKTLTTSHGGNGIEIIELYVQTKHKIQRMGEVTNEKIRR